MFDIQNSHDRTVITFPVITAVIWFKILTLMHVRPTSKHSFATQNKSFYGRLCLRISNVWSVNSYKFPSAAALKCLPSKYSIKNSYSWIAIDLAVNQARNQSKASISFFVLLTLAQKLFNISMNQKKHIFRALFRELRCHIQIRDGI